MTCRATRVEIGLMPMSWQQQQQQQQQQQAAAEGDGKEVYVEDEEKEEREEEEEEEEDDGDEDEDEDEEDESRRHHPLLETRQHGQKKGCSSSGSMSIIWAQSRPALRCLPRRPVTACPRACLARGAKSVEGKLSSVRSISSPPTSRRHPPPGPSSAPSVPSPMADDVQDGKVLYVQRSGR
ncbi:MAG: hypothetical protein M1837_001903 [Sclerophora amabilis]|nr:MAG: hypothetical protein M1837_001903 [Sclerophora amabilis]